MKKTMKKILALVLSMLMLLSVAAPVFANDVVAATCPGEDEVHDFEVLGEENCTFITHHEAKYCEDQVYDVYQCNTCGKYFADHIVNSGACDFSEIIKAATCTEDGEAKCTKCDNTKVLPALGHDMTTDAICGYKGENVLYYCTRCDYTELRAYNGEHDWTITVTKEPTCGIPGVAHYECNKCDAAKDVVIYADPDHVTHNWVYAEAVIGGCFQDGHVEDHVTAGYYCSNEGCDAVAQVGQVIVVDGKEVTVTSEYKVTTPEHDVDWLNPAITLPTCTKYGVEAYHCINCGWIAQYNPIAPTGHDIDEATATTNRTYCILDAENNIVAGKDVIIGLCVVCGETVVETKNHTIEKITVEATCVSGGYTYDYCATCDEKFNETEPGEKDETAHEFWKGENPDNDLDYGIELDATCTEEGMYYTKCKHCGLVKFDTIDAKGHDYKFAMRDCYNGKDILVCANCNDTITVDIENFNFDNIKFHANYDPTADRNWNGDWDFAAEATCTTYEVIVFKCDFCQAYCAQNNLPEKNITVKGSGFKHDFVEIETPVKYDCINGGVEGYWECSKCDATYGKKDGIIAARGEHEFEVVIPAKDATCLENGHEGYWECKHCDATKGDENAVIEALGHNIELITDNNPDALNGNAWAISCTKYTYKHYGCTRCNDESLEVWENYVAATGHTLVETVPAGCTTTGLMSCEDCDYTEVIDILKHRDAEGNVIECVFEDFYCHVCCGPIFDDEDNFTGEYAEEILDWTESHYYSHVTVDEREDCTDYYYILHVCKVDTCKAEWMETKAGFESHDEVNAYWAVTTAPTFTAPGVESKFCGRTGCTYVFETRECTRDDIEFSFTVGNIYNDKYNTELSIVNSGYIAVKVNLAAYEQMLHSFMFTLNVSDNDLLTYVGYEIPAEYSDVIYKKVYVGQNGGEITVYATIENEIDSAVRDYFFTGADNHVLTLYFKVADDANTEASTSKATFTITGSDAEVKKVDKTDIEAAFATVVDPELTISILGGVNNDAETTDGVANQIDVNAIRKLVAERGYVAEADIDKDGEITLTDFDLLAKYLVGTKTYEDICATDDCDIADKVSH